MFISLNESTVGMNKETNSTEEAIYVENYSIRIKMAFIALGVISLASSTIAIIVMARTKKTPYAARFLSKGLLIFDVLYILTCSIRKFVMSPSYNLNLNVLAQVFLQLSYVTVCLMALERLVVFNWPIAYIKHCSAATVRKIASGVWLTEACLFLVVRYAGCYLQHSSIMFVQAGLCTQIVSFYYAFVLIFVLSTAFFCYCKIFQIVRNQTNNGHKNKQSFFTTAKEIKSYKSTFIVMLYLLVIVITTFAYMVIIVYRSSGSLNVTELRLLIEVVTITNCFLDPYLYVMWFRESQMECLKLMCSWNSSVGRRVEAMRTEIYDIVTSEMHRHSSTVYPLQQGSAKARETLI